MDYTQHPNYCSANNIYITVFHKGLLYIIFYPSHPVYKQTGIYAYMLCLCNVCFHKHIPLNIKTSKNTVVFFIFVSTGNLIPYCMNKSLEQLRH